MRRIGLAVASGAALAARGAVVAGGEPVFAWSRSGWWKFDEVGAVASGRTAADTTPEARTPGGAPARPTERVRDGRAAVRVTDAAGQPLAGASVQLTQRPDSEVAGFVIDASHTAVRRARLTGADTVVTTDAAGVADVGGLPPGPYRVRATHPAIARRGVEAPVAEIVVVRDSLATRARATIAPPAWAALAARCGFGPLAPDTVESWIIYGTVFDTTHANAAGAGAPGATVTITWTRLEGGRSTRRATTDARGSFVVCGVPNTVVPTVAATREGLVAPPQRLKRGDWRAVFVPFDLRPPSNDATPRPVPPTIAVAGTIVDSVVNAPLAGAVVQMVAAAHPEGRVYQAIADSAGAFQIVDMPPDRYVVRFDHPALTAYGVELPDYAFDLPAVEPEVTIALAGPSAAHVLAHACPQVGDTAGLLIGHLRVAGDSMRTVRGQVRASWSNGARAVTASVGPDGIFRVCGVPHAGRVSVSAQLPAPWQSVPIDVLTERRGVTIADLVVRGAPVRAP